MGALSEQGRGNPEGAGAALSAAGFPGKRRARRLLAFPARRPAQGSAPAPMSLRQQKALTPDKQSLQRRVNKLQTMQISQAPEVGGLQATGGRQSSCKV